MAATPHHAAPIGTHPSVQVECYVPAMLLRTLGDLFPLAVAIAISPMPVVAVILMLGTPRALSNSLSFSAGWLGGLTAIFVVGTLIGSHASGADDTPSTFSYWVKLVLGAALLVLALMMVVKRPKGPAQPTMPKWMESIDAFGSSKSFGLGLFSSAGNLKNMPLTLAAASVVADADLAAGQSVVASIVFLVIASVTVLGPVLLYLVNRDGAAKSLASMKDFMAVHNRAIMTVLLFVLGAKLLGEGLPGVINS